MSGGSRLNPAAGGVSKRMMLAMVAMLVIIVVPAVIVSIPTSKVVVTARNVDDEWSVTGDISIWGTEQVYFSFYLEPGSEKVFSCEVRAASHNIHVYYLFEDQQDVYFWYSGMETCEYSAGMFDTDEVEISLYNG